MLVHAPIQLVNVDPKLGVADKFTNVPYRTLEVHVVDGLAQERVAPLVAVTFPLPVPDRLTVSVLGKTVNVAVLAPLPFGVETVMTPVVVVFAGTVTET